MCPDFSTSRGVRPDRRDQAGRRRDRSDARAGKSMTSSAPSRVTSSAPLLVMKRMRVRPGCSFSEITQADASVAWPHSGTSTVGVNQRSS